MFQRSTTMSTLRKVVFFALVVIGSIISINGQPIHGGSDARPGKNQWLVAISYEDKSESIFCGGAIISPRHILTAAHCVPTDWKELIVRANLNDINDGNAVVRHIAESHIHPNYQPQTDEKHKENDIAIYTLDEDLPISNGSIKTLALPSGQLEAVRGVFSGWGVWSNVEGNKFPLTLQTAVVYLLGEFTCNQISQGMIMPQYFCGAIENGYTGAGDSGGPLVSKGEVIGILASGGKRAGAASVYSYVYHYVDWIRSIIG